eukprot:sb/3477644/
MKRGNQESGHNFERISLQDLNDGFSDSDDDESESEALKLKFLTKGQARRPCTKIFFAPYILSIEIKFQAILKLEPESIGKMKFFSIQRNQDQVFILSGTGDMSENI